MKGQILSHYRVLDMVGQGASGVIYQAEDLVLGRLVALKCLPPDLQANGTAVLRFQHEARTASGINHPNICTIHEIGEADGRQFIVMEWLEGRTLANLIDRRPLKFDNLLDYTIQIAEGLHAAHAIGILHRDVKPSNILITTNGQAKILDFGISLLVSALSAPYLSQPAGLVGTAPYMSPEQVQGDDLDLRSDLFSLGIVLYEMATGRRPFIASTMTELAQMITDHVPEPPRTLNPDIPAELDRIVMKALEKNRKLRFQTAADLRADLQRLKRDFDSGTLRALARPATAPFGAQKLETATTWLRTGPAAILGMVGSTLVLIGLIASGLLPADSADSSTRVAGPERIRRTTDLLLPEEAAPVQMQEAGRTKPAGPLPTSSPVRNPTEARPVTQELVTQELGVAQKKVDAGLYDQAIETLRAILTRYGAAPQAIDAYFLIASVQEAQKKHEDAMATYLEIAHRFKGHSRGAEALYRFADVTLKSKHADRDSKARDALEQLARAYPDTPWAPRALIMKAGIEERKRLYETDALSATRVPSALVTYRHLTTAYPDAIGVEIALEKLAKLYEVMERFDLAASTFVRLGTRHPSASPDAWYRAAELYRRRLNNDQMARSAYSNVPRASRYFKDAQNRLR